MTKGLYVNRSTSVMQRIRVFEGLDARELEMIERTAIIIL